MSKSKSSATVHLDLHTETISNLTKSIYALLDDHRHLNEICLYVQDHIHNLEYAVISRGYSVFTKPQISRFRTLIREKCILSLTQLLTIVIDKHDDVATLIQKIQDLDTLSDL